MSKSLSEKEREDLKAISIANSKGIKFYKDDDKELRIDQYKAEVSLDQIPFLFEDLEEMQKISLSLVNRMLRATDRTINQFVRDQLKEEANKLIRINQMDEDQKNSPDGIEARKKITLKIIKIFEDCFDVTILKTRFQKDEMIKVVKQQTLDTSFYLDKIRNNIDQPDDVAFLENFSEKKDREKRNEKK